MGGGGQALRRHKRNQVPTAQDGVGRGGGQAGLGLPCPPSWKVTDPLVPRSLVATQQCKRQSGQLRPFSESSGRVCEEEEKRLLCAPWGRPERRDPLVPPPLEKKLREKVFM